MNKESTQRLLLLSLMQAVIAALQMDFAVNDSDAFDESYRKVVRDQVLEGFAKTTACFESVYVLKKDDGDDSKT